MVSNIKASHTGSMRSFLFYYWMIMEGLKTISRHEKVKEISKVMSNKELTMGCEVSLVITRRFAGETDNEYQDDIILWPLTNSEGGEDYDTLDFWPVYYDLPGCYIEDDSYGYIENVIWHPLMFNDVIAYIEELRNNILVSFPWDPRDIPDDYLSEMDKWIEDLLDIREYKRYDITKQTDRCVDYLYDIINH